MTGPIILERDTPIIDWRTPLAAFGTSEQAVNGYTYRMRSDGLLHAEYATATVVQSLSITALKQKGMGLNLAGPVSGLEFTPYHVSAIAMTDDINVKPVLFVAESASSITSDAGGDNVTDVRIIAVPKMHGAEGSTLTLDTVIVANENTAGRGIAIGIAMMATAAGVTTQFTWARLSVRRMIGIKPTIRDTRKQ